MWLEREWSSALGLGQGAGICPGARCRQVCTRLSARDKERVFVPQLSARSVRCALRHSAGGGGTFTMAQCRAVGARWLSAGDAEGRAMARCEGRGRAPWLSSGRGMFTVARCRVWRTGYM